MIGATEMLSPGALMLTAGLAAVAWVASFRITLPGRRSAVRATITAGRTLIGFVACWSGVILAQRWVLLTGRWPGWLLCLTGVIGCEVLVRLYAEDRRGLSRFAGTVAVGLRLLVLGLLLAVLARPVKQTQSLTDTRRQIAIVIDDSDSMQVTDKHDDTQRTLMATFRAESPNAQPPTRAAIAREALVSSLGQNTSLLDELADTFTVKLYRFAGDIAPMDTASFTQGEADKAAPAQRGETNVAAAIKHVARELPLDRLAGVLVFSDGRHNASETVSAAAAGLIEAGVPICSVVVGSRKAQPDVAVSQLNLPGSVMLGDEVAITAALTANGFRGQKVAVTLMHGDRKAETQTVDIPQDTFSTSVDFTHVPEAQGMQKYRVEAALADKDQASREVVTANNSTQPRFVAVSDERIKLLLVDGRPRWEFRYLKSLFLGRDVSVKIQHVLIHPDVLASKVRPRRIWASTTQPSSITAATDLPARGDEWMKFDAVILGDVEPAALTDETLATVSDFVIKRGGTLIVIAGPNYMPHAYSGKPLAGLLPVTFTGDNRSLLAGPEPSYRLVVSSEGRAHPIMDQGAAEGTKVWQRLQRFHWRHPTAAAKPGATVLAYADPGADAGKTAAAADAVRRQRALIAYHNVGAGKVLALTLDSTWRMRHMAGDRHHHRFWGQVLRWAHEEKLPFGGKRVRMGTDRPQYDPEQPVIVRASLKDGSEQPIAGAAVDVKVFHGDALTMSKSMADEPGVPGRYKVDLGPLPPKGPYRIEVAGERVQALLAEEGLDKVAAEIVVTADRPRSGELVDLVSDDKIPLQLAKLTGGRVVGPAEARSLLALFKDRKVTQIKMDQRIALWDNWWVLSAIVVLVCAEWILRRRKGLV